jgi:tyrosinase
MAVRVRKNIYILGDNSSEVHWYRRAVAHLRTLPSANPISWRYMASVHGVPPGTPPPPGAAGSWEECQHHTWFFLSWHRGYITAFEAVIAQTIKTLGGPSSWALPYWDYTAPPGGGVNPQLMPASFFNRTVPGTRQRNALWSTRRGVTGRNFGLNGPVISLAALNIRRFTGPSGGINPGFGGPATGWNHGGGSNGAIENLPHNAVHGQIGGLMGDPDTAGLDPIFWLHHCNIDRLWEVWRARWTPAVTDPTDPRWRSNLRFKMHDGNGNPFDFSSEEMLDTTKVLHGYVYDNVPPVVPAAPQPLAVAATGGSVEELEAMAQLIGASEAPVDITGARASTTLRLDMPTAATALTAAPGGRTWLQLENITGTGMPGNYNVHIDFPEDDRPAAWVGLLSTFGIERASRVDATHAGSGLSTAFDITELAQEMGVNQGNVANLKITFDRIGEPETYQNLPKDFADVGPALNRQASAKVGRVSLYVE